MMAIQRKIPYVTSMAAAEATVEGIEAAQKGLSTPLALQEYHPVKRGSQGLSGGV